MENALSKLSITELKAAYLNLVLQNCITELKAVVYDELAKVEQSQANIRILHQELRNRLQPQQQEVPQNGGLPQVTQSDFNPPSL